MGVAYSQYSSSWWQDYKLSLKKGGIRGDVCKESFDQYRLSLHCLILEKEKSSEDHKNLQIMSTDMILYAIYKNRFEPSIHYFIDKGLSDFLVSSVREFTEDYIKSTPTEESKGFFIHFPASENKRSLFVRKINDKPHYMATNGERCFLIRPGESYNDAAQCIEKAQTEPIKLVMGFSLYIDAFPDVVCEADGVRHVGHYKGSRHYIRANDIVRTEAHHSVSPHFRRGHFRVLSSDHFKAARGKTIFINGMFIKGKAFDVLADDYKGGAI
jgi:hypothetical protein